MDANACPYVNGTGRAVLVSGNGSGQQNWVINNTNPVQTPRVINNLDSFAKFSMPINPTTVIQPGSAAPEWQFSFCSFAYPPQFCFVMPPMPITANTDITSIIQTYAPLLPRNICPGGGSGGQGPAGNLYDIQINDPLGFFGAWTGLAWINPTIQTVNFGSSSVGSTLQNQGPSGGLVNSTDSNGGSGRLYPGVLALAPSSTSYWPGSGFAGFLSPSGTPDLGITLPSAVGSVRQVLGITSVSGDIVNTGWINPVTSYDIVFTSTGKPPDNVRLRVEVFPLNPDGTARSFSCPANMLGASGFAGTNPTSTSTWTLYDDGSSIGTMTISTGGAFTWSTSATVFVGGSDRIDINTPTPQDSTLSDVAFTLTCTPS